MADEKKPLLTRRRVLLGGAGLAGMLVLANKPDDNSGPRDQYFLDVQRALKNAGIANPTLVIDRTRLNANIDTLMGHLPDGMGYRIVAKSLPSYQLIDHIRRRAGTDKVMTFNQPMLTTISKTMPEVDQLLGKPLPVAAAKQYFDSLSESDTEAAAKVQWLVDTPVRIQQYAAFAKASGQTLRLNVELDVGLHSGGFVAGEPLAAALRMIAKDSNLSFSGFMGYEPHLSALPTALGIRGRATQSAWSLYQACLDIAAEVLGAEALQGICRNAAGSPTYRLYENTNLANEISAGSCLVKPTHFDTPLLAPHAPASFIATPVIKSFGETQLPAMEFAGGIMRAWNPNSAKTVFIYGGNWMAEPVDPPGLEFNSLFGHSSNQEMLNGGQELDIQPDDFVFFRPTQSEAVFLQFGDIAVYEDGQIADMWPVFKASA